MIVRKKNEKLRITFSDTSKPTSVQYLQIEPSGCWNSTFNAWGKKTEVPVVNLFGKMFRVVLEEIK